MKVLPGLHSLGNDHVTIQRELRYLIAAQGVGTGMLMLGGFHCPMYRYFEQP
jgi:hypothetical protein